MAAPVVRLIKYDVGSPTDLAIQKMQVKLNASSAVEAMRRSLTIADEVMNLAAKEVLWIKKADGSMERLAIT